MRDPAFLQLCCKLRQYPRGAAAESGVPGEKYCRSFRSALFEHRYYIAGKVERVCLPVSVRRYHPFCAEEDIRFPDRFAGFGCHQRLSARAGPDKVYVHQRFHIEEHFKRFVYRHSLLFGRPADDICRDAALAGGAYLLIESALRSARLSYEDAYIVLPDGRGIHLAAEWSLQGHHLSAAYVGCAAVPYALLGRKHSRKEPASHIRIGSIDRYVPAARREQYVSLRFLQSFGA